MAQNITLTAAQLAAGFVNVSFNPTADGTDFVTQASIADELGNSAGPVSDQAHLLQLSLPGAPIVTHWYRHRQRRPHQQGRIERCSASISVSVALLGYRLQAGDQLLVSANGVAPTPITPTAADLTKWQRCCPAATPAEGSTLTVDAQVKDQAGNLGLTGTSAKLDTTAPDP